MQTDIFKHLLWKQKSQRTCNTIYEMLIDRGMYRVFADWRLHYNATKGSRLIQDWQFDDPKNTNIFALKSWKRDDICIFYDVSIGGNYDEEALNLWNRKQNISINYHQSYSVENPCSWKENPKKMKPMYIIEHFFSVALMENISKHKWISSILLFQKKLRFERIQL
jgi:hypothetical protein